MMTNASPTWTYAAERELSHKAGLLSPYLLASRTLTIIKSKYMKTGDILSLIRKERGYTPKQTASTSRDHWVAPMRLDFENA